MKYFFAHHIVKSKSVHIEPARTVAVEFGAVILFGAVLLTLPAASKSGSSSGFLTALFTATSATCVTGLVVVDTYKQWTMFGQIVILLLIQIGGLGFMIMATMFSLAFRRKISLKERLVLAESLNQYNLQGIVELARKILRGTLAIEAVGALFLSCRFVPLLGYADGIYYSIFHAVSAFCNAGFDIMGRYGSFSNLTTFVDDPVVNIVIMSLIVIGGLGFVVLSDIADLRHGGKLHLHSKLVLVMTGSLLLFGFFFFLAAEYNNPGTLGPLKSSSKVLAAMFMSVTPRTAGFNTINLAGMKTSSICVTIFLMFIGGSPGSTAGGIKTTTFGIMLLTVISVSKGRDDTEIFHKRLPRSVVRKAFILSFINISVVSVMTIILIIADNVKLVQALYEVCSAFGTVGLTLGITPKLSSISRIALILSMYFGRVGTLTIILALSNRSSKDQLEYRYPEEKIMVG